MGGVALAATDDACALRASEKSCTGDKFVTGIDQIKNTITQN